MATVFATISTPGPPGATGPPGYSPRYIVAAGVPSSGTGNDGDMYINSTTSDVYGPKTAGAWGSIVCNIRGTTGAAGPAGYTPQYIVASGAPAGATGNNGDMYINSATSDVYGPKTAGAWGPIVCNIKGSTGPTGPPGVAYTPKGAWAAGTTYAQGDEVTDVSILYISLQSSNTGHVPASNPTWWLQVGAGTSQTPWLSNINGGGFNLTNAGAISASGNVLIGPLSGTLPDANTNPTLVVGSAATTSVGEITAGSNQATIGGLVGTFQFANYNLSVADKRIAALAGAVDTATNGGCLIFYTWNAGTASEKMRVTAAGNVGIGVNPPAYKLDVAGDCNLSAGSVYRVNGVPIGDGTVYIAYASTFLTLTGTRQDIPGCSLTLTRAGRYLITGIFSFNKPAGAPEADVQLFGSLNAGGSLQSGEALFGVIGGSTVGGWATVAQHWVYVATAGAVAKLQAYKGSGTGSSSAESARTSISAIWVASS